LVKIELLFRADDGHSHWCEIDEVVEVGLFVFLCAREIEGDFVVEWDLFELALPYFLVAFIYDDIEG
jgi:hypothetical protein